MYEALTEGGFIGAKYHFQHTCASLVEPCKLPLVLAVPDVGEDSWGRFRAKFQQRLPFCRGP